MVLTHIQGDPVSVPWTMTVRLVCSVAKLSFCKRCTWAVTWLGCGEMAHVNRKSLWLEVKGQDFAPTEGEEPG